MYRKNNDIKARRREIFVETDEEQNESIIKRTGWRLDSNGKIKKLSPYLRLGKKITEAATTERTSRIAKEEIMEIPKLWKQNLTEPKFSLFSFSFV